MSNQSPSRPGDGPLAGRVALITGASRGIGRATALALAGCGADLILSSTQTGGTAACEAEVRALGRRAVGIAADLADPAQVDRLWREAATAFGQVDVLVNNAGVLHWAPVAQTGDADFARVMAVNVAAPHALIHRALPGMLERRWGRILNVSSISATMGTANLAGYCASKWALNGLTRALAAELKNTGVLVFAVMPGSVDTQMLKATPFTPEMTPEDVAGTIRYLCAEAPAAMNGSLTEIFG